MGPTTIHLKIKLQHQESSTSPLSARPRPPCNLPLLHYRPCTYRVNLVLTHSILGDCIKWSPYTKLPLTQWSESHCNGVSSQGLARSEGHKQVPRVYHLSGCPGPWRPKSQDTAQALGVKSLPPARSKSVATWSLSTPSSGAVFPPSSCRRSWIQRGRPSWSAPLAFPRTASAHCFLFLPSPSSNTQRWGSRALHPSPSNRKGSLLNTMSDTGEPEPGKGRECDASQEGKREPKGWTRWFRACGGVSVGPVEIPGEDGLACAEH